MYFSLALVRFESHKYYEYRSLGFPSLPEPINLPAGRVLAYELLILIFLTSFNTQYIGSNLEASLLG